jgi:hypothetical protein
MDRVRKLNISEINLQVSVKVFANFNHSIGSQEKKSYLSIDNKLLIYKTVINPIWTYDIELWGCASME